MTTYIVIGERVPETKYQEELVEILGKVAEHVVIGRHPEEAAIRVADREQCFISFWDIRETNMNSEYVDVWPQEDNNEMDYFFGEL